MFSPEPRVEKILAELQSRYDLQDDFLAKLRPMVSTVLSDEIDDEQRTGLLEMVAETCERDLRLRKGSVALKSALQSLVDTLRELHDKVRELGERQRRPDAEGA